MIDVKIDGVFQHDLTDEQQDRLPELLDAAGLHLAGMPDNLGLVFTAVLRFLLRNATDPSTEEQFRHVLIDSRSGLADVGGLCLRGLPDSRVVLSGLNKQNLEGTRMVLNTLSREERGEDELIVVFSPVPEGEADLVDERIKTAKDTLTFRDADGEDHISEEQIQLLHYHPRIALEEKPFTEPFHRRTRIFDEYEDLTDELLELTGSDARSLVSNALEHFQEDEDSKDETTTEKGSRYEQLVSELIPAAFLDKEHVELTVGALCTQMRRNGPYNLEATSLFELWIALAPQEFRVLNASAHFYDVVRQEAPSGDSAESLLRRSLKLDKRISKLRSDDLQIWYNWGTHLTQLAQLVQAKNTDRADSLYLEAFEKYRKAVDINPDDFLTYYNWGIYLVRLGRLLRSQNQSLNASQAFSDAVEKLQSALSNDGGRRALLWLIVALVERDTDDDIVGTVSIIADITEQKARQRRLERQNERLEEFASFVSHDLRNPLQVAAGHLQLARSGEGDPTDHIDDAEDALGRMEELIDDTLTLARQGRAIGETDPVQLARLAERAWANVATSGGRLAVADPPVVDCDPDRVVELLENLFSNAITHGGGTEADPVTVTVGEMKDGFYVADDGIGIPESKTAAVFESGFTTAEDGTGFGLDIVQTIADAHGWRVNVTESENGGARFQFLF